MSITDTPSTPFRSKPARQDRAHELILPPATDSAVMTGYHTWRALLMLIVTGLVIAVLNSQVLVTASRSLPIGPLRFHGERIALTWHGWMEGAGLDRPYATLQGSVQWVRSRSWPDLTPEPATPDQAQARLRSDMASLLACLKTGEFQMASAQQRTVKDALSGELEAAPSPAPNSRLALERDPAALSAAIMVCGYNPLLHRE